MLCDNATLRTAPIAPSRIDARYVPMSDDQRMTAFVAPAELGAKIKSGAKLAVPPDGSGASIGLTKFIIDNGAKGLHLVCAPVGGLQVDMLIGAGLVSTIETSAVSLGEAGGTPSFTRAIKSQTIRIMDATCPAMLTGLMAAQKGVPFIPMRGLIGSDILRTRPDWTVIDNPYEKNDPIVAIPAIRPDVCLFHAPEADCDGNVRVGRRGELQLLAYASAITLVTVERIVEKSLLRDEATAAGVLPSLYVSAIAEMKNGAWPNALWGEYEHDAAEISRYAAAARTQAGFESYMNSFAGVLA
jgi:glutaconate CoA-transferase, subunit A